MADESGIGNRIYLDWNATAEPLPAAVDAIRATMVRSWANAASVHAEGRAARAVVESAREMLASFAGYHPRDVVFTSGGTEANNQALRSARAVVTSRIEHPSIIRQAQDLEARGVPVHWLAVGPSGAVSPTEVSDALEALPKQALVAVSAVNHETGVVQPVVSIGGVCKAHGARLHVDAVQWAGKRAMATLSLADSISLAAHKLGGPKGIGALLFRGRPPVNVLHGGEQERGVRPGTVAPALASGFEAALRVASTCYEEARLAQLRDRLEQAVSAHSSVNGTGERLGHVTNLSFHDWPGPELVAALDLRGIAVSSGSACSAGTSEPSRVVAAMNGPQRAQSAVRFSLGRTTTADQIEVVAGALLDLLTRAR